jgi:hypothetical protein
MKAFLFLMIISVVVALCLWLPNLMLNPGRLTQGHQEIENSCTSCHKLLWGIKDSGCMACHKPDQIGKDSFGMPEVKKEFHAQLKDQTCTSCHTDHKGTDPALSRFSFNHQILSATTLADCKTCHANPMDSLHAKFFVTCGSCHNTGKWKFTGNFDHNLLTGNSKNICSSCHLKPSDDLHMSLNNCVDCHSTFKWSPATFDHSTYFILDNDHNAKCITCHTTENNFKIYSCYGCHEHSESKIAREHQEEGISNFSDCASCHKSSNKHDIRSEEREENKQNVERIRQYVEPRKEDKDRKEHDDD